MFPTMILKGWKPYLAIAATAAVLCVKDASAATVVSIYSDDQCQTLIKEVHGPNNGSCVNAIRNAAGWIVSSWDDGCLVHMADDKYGDDNLRQCAAVTAQAQTAYTNNCYPSNLNFTHYSITNCSSTSSDIALFSIDGSSNTTSSTEGLIFGEDGLGLPTNPSASSSSSSSNPTSSPSTSTNNGQNTSDNGNNGGLSTGGKIAIGVAVPVGVIAGTIGLWFLLKRRPQNRENRSNRFVDDLAPRNENYASNQAPQESAIAKQTEKSSELEESRERYELGAKSGTETARERIQELPSVGQIQELPANERGLK